MIIILMGVSGTGKTTIGKLLSKQMGIPFYDGDDYHPEANKQKMAAGEPLNDEDRVGWLASLNTLAQQEASDKGAIIACSALREQYRTQLQEGIEDIYFVHLVGSYELILERMQAREGHFMPSELLQSQFDTLEAPEGAIVLSIELSPEDIVAEVQRQINKN